MKKSIPGLSPLWLISLALVLAVVLVIGIPLVIQPQITGQMWSGFAGSVVTGTVALVAAAIAFFNVNRQMHINVISREEERIEKELPALREIADYFLSLRPFLVDKRAAYVGRDVQSFIGIHASQDDINVLVRSALPQADQQTLTRIISALSHLMNSAFVVALDEKRIAEQTTVLEEARQIGNEPDVERLQAEVQHQNSAMNMKRLTFEAAKNNLLEIERETVARISKYEQRRLKFRRTLEAYFDD